ncbi:unnamed protein product [Trichobilharzia szidati]|nr:unnamed protein product [Trichobilharzia szidati]CAH8837692.1 unnamed protein product [Trichobilharzia szidati]CAH8837695.1 unnamed protein product [Trichobilharzia szidati]
MILTILVVLWVVAYIYFYFKSKSDFPHFVPVMIIMGSGGHTSEMLSYVSSLTTKYQPRTYVIAKTDALSEEKVLNCETRRGILFDIKRIHRAREVRQSFMSSILSASVSFLHSLPLVVQCRPKLILCNGPGTCIPVCFVALLLRVLGLHSSLIVFVESICRTKTLSLSGKILYYTRLVDVIVQWPELKTKYPRSVYLGLLS